MAGNHYFQFKQFRIEQHHAAMRVNTDGVLLGAWTCLENAESILDIGTGTGLIALMVAQRCNAGITGIDIDEQAAIEASRNVSKSAWTNRIEIRNISFQEFSLAASQKFDVIVSNPPYFSNSVKNHNPRLSLARHNHSLPFTDIIRGTLKLLNCGGKLSLILPAIEALTFIEKAEFEGLLLTRCTKVKPFPEKEPNRFLMEFGLIKSETETNSISVFDESKTTYSDDFIKLAKDFYLKL